MKLPNVLPTAKDYLKTLINVMALITFYLSLITNICVQWRKIVGGRGLNASCVLVNICC